MEEKHWNTAWGIAMSDFSIYQLETENHVQRLNIKNNVNGSAVRLHFNNRHGKECLVFSAVTLQVNNGESSQVVGVTQDGSKRIVLASGEETYSDELPLAVAAGDTINICVQIEDKMPLTDIGLYLHPGLTILDSRGTVRSGSAELPEPLRGLGLIYGIDRVELLGKQVKEIAFFGDSITQMGYWTTPLAMDLYAQYRGEVSVFNCGIGGNRILYDPPAGVGGAYGEAALARFEKDVFEGKSPALVVVQIGINDLCHPVVYNLHGQAADASAVIKGLYTLANAVHQHNVQAVCCTLLPFKGYRAWSPALEEARQTINSWVRANDAFDDYFDFDHLLRDKDDVLRMQADCHMGDWLHPNKKGGGKLADGVSYGKLL